MAPTAEREKEILKRIEEPERYAGHVLYDPLNHRIGVVENVFVSEFGEPQYVRVDIKGGLFRRSSILLPVDRVAADKHRAALILQ